MNSARTALCRLPLCAFFAALFFVVPAGEGCAQSPSAVVAPDVYHAPSVRGGVRYEASAPLNATITPVFDAAHPPALLTFTVRYQGAGGQEVPGFYVTSGSDGKPKPTVLILHGLGGNKEQMAFTAAAFAGRGFNAFAIDAAGHGKRPLIHGKPVAQLNLDELHTLAGQTIEDLRRAVDWLQTRPDVDKERIGFLGVSLGGILGGVFAADDTRVKATVLWAAGGDWGQLLTTTTHPFAAAFRKTGAANAVQVEAVMSDVDPLTAISHLAPRPLLMLNGDKDTVVPVACANALYNASGDPKERVILPGGHIPDFVTMQARSLQWLSARFGVTAPMPPKAATVAAPQ